MANLSYIYAALMFILGLFGFLSNPSKAMSALIVGGVTAIIFTVLGLYIKKENKRALTILTFLGALLSIMLVWRTSSAWSAYLMGKESKLMAALLISAMLLITLVITGLGFSLRRRPRK